MALPALRDDGWLPEGHHQTTWEEIALRFGGEPESRRAQVFGRLLRWRNALRKNGMGGKLVLNGSFISDKFAPGDFDCILIFNEVTERLLGQQDSEAQALTDYARCKDDYGGDVLALAENSVRRFPQFCRTDSFDRDKATLLPKGVVEVPV